MVPGHSEARTFGTTTRDLLTLLDWVGALQVTHVAMESTGVYWKPLYNLLETTGMTVYVVNAAHMKAVPGRKTDVQDAEWICDLMRHGLLKASLIPSRPQRELRELVRYRITLVSERAAEANRIQKVLEGGNIKLGSVVSDILGKSGRAMLDALAAGQVGPEDIAALAVPIIQKIPLAKLSTRQLRARRTQRARSLPTLEAVMHGALVIQHRRVGNRAAGARGGSCTVRTCS